MCREHAQQLAQLAAQDRQLAVLATVKETGHDDEALLELYEQYFHRLPIFKDEKLQVYKAIGGRQAEATGFLAKFQAAKDRLLRKKIAAGSVNGDKFMLGGLLIFDRKGTLIHTIEEQVGEPLDIADLQQKIAFIRSNHHQKEVPS